MHPQDRNESDARHPLVHIAPNLVMLLVMLLVISMTTFAVVNTAHAATQTESRNMAVAQSETSEGEDDDDSEPIVEEDPEC